MPLIRKNGVLQYVSGEEAGNLQQKAEQQQIPTPITPGGAAGVGGTPDQAKMAGVPVQKQNVLGVEVAKEQKQQQPAQVRKQVTAEESAAQQKSDRIRNLGYLESRIDDILQAKVQQAVQVPQGPVTFEAAATLPEEVKTALATYQQAQLDLQQDPENVEKQQAAKSSYVDLLNTQGADTAEVKQFIDSIQQTTGTQAAEQIAAPLTLADVNLQTDLGGTTPEEMTQLLGADWQTFTVEQLKQKIDQIRTDEFTRAEKLQTELQDPLTSAARRQEIRNELKDLSQIGVIGTEYQVKSVEQSVENAETINFQGQELKIEDILADDFVSKQVVDMLSLPEDQKIAKEKELADLYGQDFIDWVTQHSEALKQLGQEMETTATAVQDISETNKDVGNVDLAGQGSGTLPEELLKDLFPQEYGKKWTTTDFQKELKNTEWYQTLTGDTSILPGNKQKFLTALKDFDLTPAFASELGELDRNEVTALMNDPKMFRNALAQEAQYIDPDELTADQRKDANFLADYIFGKDVDVSQLQETFNKERLMADVYSNSRYTKEHAASRDTYKNIMTNGKLDANKMLAYISNSANKDKNAVKLSLADMASGKKPDSAFNAFENKDTAKTTALFTKLYPYLKGDSKASLDNNDIASLYKNDRNTLYNLAGYNIRFSVMSKDGRNKINDLISSDARKASQGTIDYLEGYDTPNVVLPDELIGKKDSDIRKTYEDLSSKINASEDQLRSDLKSLRDRLNQGVSDLKTQGLHPKVYRAARRELFNVYNNKRKQGFARLRHLRATLGKLLKNRKLLNPMAR